MVFRSWKQSLIQQFLGLASVHSGIFNNASTSDQRQLIGKAAFWLWLLTLWGLQICWINYQPKGSCVCWVLSTHTKVHCMGNSGTGTTLINSGLLSTPATLAVSLFIDSNDNNQLIKFHLHQWTTNPISKHHHNTDRGMRVWESGLNNSEIDLCTSSPDKHVVVLRGGKAYNKCFVLFVQKKHTSFLIMTFLYIHILYTNI